MKPKLASFSWPIEWTVGLEDTAAGRIRFGRVRQSYEDGRTVYTARSNQGGRTLGPFADATKARAALRRVLTAELNHEV